MSHPKVKLSDDSGNAVSVTSNRLDVNAYLAATPTIDIGDVSLLLDGTAADYGTGNVNTSGRTLRVTIASDDYHFGAVGASSDVDGNVHGQLRFIGDNVKTVADYWGVTSRASGAQFSEGQYGFGLFGVRNDTLATLCSDENDYTPLQVNASGALYVAGTVDLGSTDNAVLDAMVVDLAAMEALLITIDADTDAIKTAVQILDDWDDSNYANVNINLAGSDAPTGGGVESGALRVTLANDSTGVISIDDGGNTITVDGTVDLGSTATAHLSEIEGAVETIEGAVSGNEMQVDVVAALPAGDNNIGNVDIASSVTLSVNSHAVTNAGTFAVQSTLQSGGKVGHDIAGMQSDNNEGVDDTTAEALGSSQACKRVDMQADSANTGYIYVGGSDVSATKGIRLAPGDFYSIDINNVANIYVLASVDEEDIHFTYYT